MSFSGATVTTADNSLGRAGCGDADTTVLIVEGETMYSALTKAGAPASFTRIEGARRLTTACSRRLPKPFPL
jgi:hypothetical protein